MPKGIYVTLKDIQAVKGCTTNHASKIKRRCLDILGKTRKDLTIIEFCQIEEITPTEFNKAVY